MSAPTTQAGTVPEDEKPVADMWCSPLGVYRVSLRGNIGKLTRETEPLIRLSGLNLLREEAESWRRVAERCKAEADEALSKLSTAEQQLSELRAEMETVRGDLDDARRENRTAREALEPFARAAEGLAECIHQNLLIWAREVAPRKYAIVTAGDLRAALRASTAGRPTDGD